MHRGIWWGILKESLQLEDLGVSVRIILKCIVLQSVNCIWRNMENLKGLLKTITKLCVCVCVCVCVPKAFLDYLSE